jgi:two-component sensor histidine kinase
VNITDFTFSYINNELKRCIMKNSTKNPFEIPLLFRDSLSGINNRKNFSGFLPQVPDSLVWNLLESIPTNVSIWKKGELIYANPAYYKSTGIPHGNIEKLRKAIQNEEHFLVHPDDYDYCVRNTKMIKEELKKGHFFNREVRMKSVSSDEYRWFNTYLVRGRGKDSDITMELDEDIHDKKCAVEKLSNTLKEKDILIKEIHHRVKNNFQIISSLLRLQQSKLKDNATKDILLESENRVKSMSMIHESLYNSDDLANIDFGDYIKKLIESLVNAYSGRTRLVKFWIESNNIKLGVDMAIPCSLIITELVTNSFKHGFDDSMKPHVHVNLSQTGKQYILLVKDNGVGFPDSFFGSEVKDTLGIMLVDTLSKQLGGLVEYKNNSGAEALIKFTAL